MTPVADLTDKLRRAARNGTRLHLDPVHIKALLSPRIYAVLATLESEELNQLCGQDNEPGNRHPVVINSAPSGSGIVPTATTGRSVGLMVEQHAAEALASEEALRICRQKKLRTH